MTTKQKAKARAYYLANQDKLLRYQKKYYKANRVWVEGWRAEHKEEIAEYQRAYRAEKQLPF